MAMGLRFLSLLILSLDVTRALSVPDHVYCDVEDNVYYVRQWGKCKACDRCPPGYGLNTKRNVELDPVYGAVQCRGCVKCIPGETFKSIIGYGECLSCTNCTGLGQSVGSACSIEADAVCTEIPQGRPPTNTQQDVQQSDLSDFNGDGEFKQVSEKEHTDGMNPWTTVFGAAILVTLVPMTAFTVLVIYRKKLTVCRKDRNQPKDVEEQRSLKDQQTNEDLTTLETAVESAPLNIETVSSPSCDRPPSMQSGDFPSLASNFTYHLGNDIETDTVTPTDLRSNEIPSDRELQGLCTSIAHKNLYARLGRELGVKDNEIQRIKEEQKQDLQETAFQTLKKWRELKGAEATKSVLRQALNNIGLNDVRLRDDP